MYQLNQVYEAADQMVLYLSSLVMAGMVHIPACICWEALSENVQYIQNIEQSIQQQIYSKFRVNIQLQKLLNTCSLKILSCVDTDSTR